MKTFKTLSLLILVISISFTSCEKEETSESLVSVEEEVKEFENSLKSDDDTPSDPAEIDCSFDGVIEARVRIGHFVGVNEFPFRFGSDAVVTWTVNGETVTPRRPRFVRVNDHISQAGQVEVCYSVTSSECGTLGECIVIDFQG
ncbi:hypothetical protein [Aquimarina aggregata]|uniref:hypothetical protein n=1 Tax=Aquimarina aggregata TaxID=1642818 RepID=UPI0024914011|nr:hypothetical protein [Aquimarina aggregata]